MVAGAGQPAGERAPTGYAHPDYARAFAEWGAPRPLPASGGWILQRPIDHANSYDAMGCYPLFACINWSQLPNDLDGLADELVTLALVTDPFGDYTPADLSRWFGDAVFPFKEHYVTDLQRPARQFVSTNHRRNAAQALRQLRVEHCPDPLQFLDDWVALYGVLIDRHAIGHMRAFSEKAFLQQLQVPGLVVFRAVHADETVSMLLWYVMEGVAYYHLGASSAAGYERRASFALFWEAIGFFASRGLRWLDLGAGAGLQDSGGDGLSRFKRGWATATRTAYFCGRIFDRKRYAELAARTGREASAYFPAYRHGEFG